MTKNKIDKILKKTNLKITNLQKQINQYPQGHLVASRNGKYYKHYCCNNGKKKYISKSNYDLVLKLAKKKYLQSRLSDLMFEKKLMTHISEAYNGHQSSEDLLLNNPTYREIIAESFRISSNTGAMNSNYNVENGHTGGIVGNIDDKYDAINMMLWMNADYEKNKSHPENLNKRCLSGHVVRSKSESMIDQALFFHQIPFRYECAFQANEIKLFPDFTIMHPQTHEIYYWEHFGLMENPSYAQNAFQKMKLYNSCGIIPSINLIMTFETQDHPLTSDLIEEIIEHYFL